MNKGNAQLEEKSAHSRAFEHYMRTGEQLTTAQWLVKYEQKYNQRHREDNGQFDFALGGTSAIRAGTSEAGMTERPRAKRITSPIHSGAQLKVPTQSQRPRRVAEVPGYPEDRHTVWRASNDLAFEAAADYSNKRHGLKRGDSGFRTPEFLKAWAMRESGGEGNREAFMSDPFQVNNPGDWVPEKATILGLRRGQRMTPAISAHAALEWLRQKSLIRDARGQVIGRRSELQALERYNGRSDRSPQSGSEHHRVWYARTIFQMARQAEANKK